MTAVKRNPARKAATKVAESTIEKDSKVANSDSDASASDSSAMPEKSSVGRKRPATKKKVVKSTAVPANKKKKASKVADSDSDASGSDSSAIPEKSGESNKRSARKKQISKNTSVPEMKLAEYLSLRDEWLSKPITGYSAEYVIPCNIGTKKFTEQLLEDVPRTEVLSINKWILENS